MKDFYKEDYLNFENVNTNGKDFSKKELIDKKSAIYDLEQFMFILNTSCISFYQLKQKQKYLAFREYKKIQKYLNTINVISVTTFFDLLLKIVKNIKDFHSCMLINSDEKKFYAFGEKHIPLYNEKIYEYDKQCFVNIEDKNDIIRNVKMINKVKKIKKNEKYFVPIINNSTQKYRLLFFSATGVSDFSEGYLPVKFDWNYLPLYQKEFNNSKCSYWIFPDDTWDEEKKEERYNDIYQETKLIKQKEIVIIENRANFGGIPNRQMSIIFSLFKIENYLNDYCDKSENNILEGTCLISALIAKKTLQEIQRYNLPEDKKCKLELFWKSKLESKFDSYIQKQKKKEWWEYNKDIQKEISFSGLIVLIINQDTMSWGEGIYNFIKNVLGYNKILLIGTNSRGCIAYGNSLYYRLRNSNIDLHLSSTTDLDMFQSKFFKRDVECRGFIPDIWTCSEEELYKTLQYIQKQKDKIYESL